ncbi:MCM DNA helicase complex subunit [Chamberlinius hualienensis]
MGDTETDQKLRDIQREYLDFLDDEEDQGYCSQHIRNMIANNEERIIININHLRRKNPTRANNLLNVAFEEIIAFERALKEMVTAGDTQYAKEHPQFFIGYEGSFGSKHVNPRTLSSRNLGNLVCVEGIVTKCSLIRPKVVRSVHYCPATKKMMERGYTDLTSYEAFPSAAAYPTKDDDGNPLETEFGLSTYKDHQTLTIQEMPEKSPPGQLPRSVDIVCDNDLVDACKPGDRVQVIGVFRCLPGKKNGYTTGTFRTILIACNVICMNKEVSSALSKEDVSKCRRFSRQKGDCFEILARSLAPSIHGHEYIKKALLCMLLGGVEKVLPNGTRLRGDINVLLIGDPSVAKSQLLRYIYYSAPRAVATTGRGSSGVGLTAAVTTDHETGERRLEAGAMVLADRGVVCIDEFDKMSDIDRTAIHEVMEQGRVTISKAGILASLNARCSVLAAANPVYGKYDQYKTPMENIGLQDSLLSRFDLLFIVLDSVDPENDRMISDHVVRMHQYRAPNEQDGEAFNIKESVDVLTTQGQNENDEEDDDESPIYEKYNALLHGGLRSKKDKIVSVKFMKKFITLAKSIKPVLTNEASEAIAEEYSRLRSQDTINTNIARTQPVTARALETLIRLSTAHAKCRLSSTVDVEDAHAAIELVQYAYFKKVMERERKRRRAAKDDSAESDADETEVETPKKKRTRSQQAKQPGEEGYDPYDFDNAELTGTADMETESTGPTKESVESVPVETPTIDDSRFELFKTKLQRAFQSAHAQSLTVNRIMTTINDDPEVTSFSQPEVDAALEKMMDANQVMVADSIVFLI